MGFSLFQLMLIFRVNRLIGLSDVVFSLGDNMMAAVVSGVQFLPACIMYVALCPSGSEGSSYAMLTTFNNIALAVGGLFGNAFGDIWDVSNEAMEAGNYSGLWRLSLLTSLLQIVPLVFVGLLPASRAQHLEDVASESPNARNPKAGLLFLTVLALCLTASVAESLYENFWK